MFAPRLDRPSGRTSRARWVGALLLLAAVALLWASAGARTSRSEAAAGPPVAPAAAGDWPMYGHDLSRTNYNAAETQISAATVNQLVSRWQQPIGIGPIPSSSAPSVAGGRVFVGSSVVSGTNYFAFDAVVGTPLWSANLGHNACFQVGIGATAAISGSVLAVGGGDSAYYGRNAATGAPLWRDPLYAGTKGFPWASPMFANNRVYLGVSANDCNPAPAVRGAIRSVDPLSGTLLVNKFLVPPTAVGAGVWNSPALSPDGSTLVIATSEDNGANNGPYVRAMVSLDPITLHIIEYRQEGQTGVDQDWGTTPVIFHDNMGRVLVGAGHKDQIFYTYIMHHLDAGAIWTRSIGTFVGMMPAYDPSFGSGGTLFMVGKPTTLYAVDPATGADRWAPVTLPLVYGNMAIANGLIFLNPKDGGLMILDEHTGALLRTLTPAHVGHTFTGPVVANGFIYWVSGPYLNAWSLPTPAR